MTEKKESQESIIKEGKEKTETTRTSDHSNKPKKNILTDWLEKLQQESWQLELLISGFAIFGLFGLENYLGSQIVLYNANIGSGSGQLFSIGGLILLTFALVTRIFIVNLLVHILVRGLWIGAIGLRYVSHDIDYDKLNYSNQFIDYYKKVVGSFDEYIAQLEKFASIIFSYTFLLFFVSLSTFLFVIELSGMQLILFNFGLDSSVKYISILIIFLGIVVGFDFISLGLLKKIKQRHFSKIYLYIYKTVSFLTLSFLWRPLLLNFLDQKYTRRLLFFILPYIAIFALIVPRSEMFEYSYFPSFYRFNSSTTHLNSILNKHTFNTTNYDSMRQEKDGHIISILSLPSNRVSGNIFEVFIKYDNGTERYITSRDTTLPKLLETGFTNGIILREKFSSYTKEQKEDIIAQHTKSPKNKDKVRDSLEIVFRKQDEYIFEKTLKQIKQYIQESTLFFIDNQAISMDKVSFDFYEHPNADEKGLLCFFPIELETGRHYFTYKKITVSANNKKEFDTISFTVPLIYE